MPKPPTWIRNKILTWPKNDTLDKSIILNPVIHDALTEVKTASMKVKPRPSIVTIGKRSSPAPRAQRVRKENERDRSGEEILLI